MTNPRVILDEVKAVLAACGRPYELEHGTKHIKVKIDGKMIGVLCRFPGRGRDSKHVIGQIRTYLKRNPVHVDQ